MKKNIVLSLLLIVGLVLASCATSNTEYGKGKEMSLNFESNPSTGYDWVYEFLEGDKYAQIVLSRQDNDFPENGVTGSGGHRIYGFRALTPGNQTLIFTYRRPWEGGEIAYDVVYDLKVDNDLNITCTAKKKGKIKSDKELSFFPDPVFAE